MWKRSWLKGYRKKGSELLGRTSRNEMVVFSADSKLIGSFVNVRLEELTGSTFTGGLV